MLKPALSIILLLSIFLAYPLMLFFPTVSSITPHMVNLFSTAEISVMCCLVLLIYPDVLSGIFARKPWLAASFAAIFLLSLYHFLGIGTYSYVDFFAPLMLVACPLAFMCLGQDARRHAAYFFVCLLLLDFANVFFWNNTAGIPGNWNWHAGMLLAAAPPSIFLIYRLSGRYVSAFWGRAALTLVPALPAAYIIVLCNTRAAWLALASAAAVLFLLRWGRSRRIMSWAAAALLCLGALIFLRYSGKIAGAVYNDVRLPLWSAALRLVADHPVAGVGMSGYESAYTSLRGINYFIRSNYVSSRSSHPHSQPLFIAGALGLTGLAAWLYVMLYPLARIILEFRRFDVPVRVLALSMLMVLVQSLFDMTMVVWPTVYISLILAGLLWREVHVADGCLAEEGTPAAEAGTSLFRALKYAACAVLIAVFAAGVFRNLNYSYHIRSSWVHLHAGRTNDAVRSADEAFRYSMDPVNICHAGVVSLAANNDHLLALHFLSMLKDTPCEFIGHSNDYLAACSLRMGRRLDAMDYLDRELQIFPLSLVSLYNKMRLEIDLGRSADAEKTANAITEVLQFKSLKLEDLAEILKDPFYDSNFHEVKYKKGEPRPADLKSTPYMNIY